MQNPMGASAKHREAFPNLPTKPLRFGLQTSESGGGEFGSECPEDRPHQESSPLAAHGIEKVGSP